MNRTRTVGPGRLALIAAAAIAAGACGGDAATEPSLNPSKLVLPDEAPDTVTVGGSVATLRARVENPAGDPVEGVPVRFLLASGPGEVMPNLAVTNGEGIAQTEFRAASEFGTSIVRADIPSASNVESRRIQVVTVPADEVSLTVRGGRDQRAEVGSQLPLPFRLRVTASGGTPAAGVAVRWTLTDGPSSARLASDTTFTDGQGRTRNLLTLGDSPGEHVVTARAAGDVVSDSVEFRAEAVTSLSTSVRIDSVAPLPLRAGAEAALFGRGFDSGSGAPEVRVEGTPGDVVEVDSGRVRFRVPDFGDRCLPAREVGVRALVGGEASNGALVALRPAPEPLDLAVGETERLEGAAAVDCVHLAGSSDGREYLVTAGTSGRTAGEIVPLRLFLRVGGTEEQTAVSEAVASARRSLSPGGGQARKVRGREIQLRQQARRELARQGFDGPLSVSSPPRAAAREGAGPSVGDTLDYTFSVGRDLAVACSDTSRVVGGVVRAVGSRVLLVEDTLTPQPSFSDQQWARLRDEFDQVVLPTDSAYFGRPADIDRNGRIVVLFTPEVNRLTPRSAEGRIGGFFLPLDLTDSGDPQGAGLQGPDGAVCPASNEAELVYLATPDPDGRFSSPMRRDQALRNARSVVAHELEHLLSAEQRLVFGDATFDQLGEVWLQEGLAHLAEEVVGLRLMDRRQGENITWDEIIDDRRQLDRFNTFHLDNFARLDLFMRQPTGAPVLATAAPGGTRGLQMRGFAWSLVRWLADQEAPGSRVRLIRTLSRGGASHASGIRNLEQASGRRWPELLADYRLSIALDDAGTGGLPSEVGIRTWDLRSIFAGLNQDAPSRTSFPFRFPLAVADLPTTSTAVDFEVQASTAAYFRLGDARGTRPATLRLTGQGGGRLEDRVAPQITVVRTR